MRKRLGVVTVCPESDFQQRVLSGIYAQAVQYNYDVFVFSPLAHVSTKSKDYVKGELNIFNLINFDLLDAVIINILDTWAHAEVYTQIYLVANNRVGCYLYL